MGKRCPATHAPASVQKVQASTASFPAEQRRPERPLARVVFSSLRTQRTRSNGGDVAWSQDPSTFWYAAVDLLTRHGIAVHTRVLVSHRVQHGSHNLIGPGAWRNAPEGQTPLHGAPWLSACDEYAAADTQPLAVQQEGRHERLPAEDPCDGDQGDRRGNFQVRDTESAHKRDRDWLERSVL